MVAGPKEKGQASVQGKGRHSSSTRRVTKSGVCVSAVDVSKCV
jgi:hypothetical protein